VGRSPLDRPEYRSTPGFPAGKSHPEVIQHLDGTVGNGREHLVDEAPGENGHLEARFAGRPIDGRHLAVKGSGARVRKWRSWIRGDITRAQEVPTMSLTGRVNTF
jgi:hypothetical protein